MTYTLKNEKIEAFNNTLRFAFPKYTSQLINWANQNAQGTRPAVVGQMSELFPEFAKTGGPLTVENWEKWYVERHPDALEAATSKIWGQIQNLQKAIVQITPAMVRNWVYDLVIVKTFNGLYVQKVILASLAEKKCLEYRLATPDEESRGIDGFVGEVAYSVKPESYRLMNRLPEAISVKMIYYSKTKTGLKIEVDE